MSGRPHFSIVTPSYNQCQFLEQTIASVLNQGYPDLEYIVMDGGSTDDSAEIIRGYQDRLAYWTSAGDAGQADAVYRGFEMSTGEILAYLNSDDYYLPGALETVAAFFDRTPAAELVIGNCIVVDQAGQLLRKERAFPVTFSRLLHWRMGFRQPASFWRREAFFESGGFDTGLMFCFDYDMYFRLTRRRRAHHCDRYIAAFRVHPASKTSTMQHVRHAEDHLLHTRYGRFTTPRWRRALMVRLFRLQDRKHVWSERVRPRPRPEAQPPPWWHHEEV